MLKHTSTAKLEWERDSLTHLHSPTPPESISEVLDRYEVLRMLAERVPQAMEWVSTGFDSFSSEIARINADFLRRRDIVEGLSGQGFEDSDRVNIGRLIGIRAVQDLLDLTVPADTLGTSPHFLGKRGVLRQEVLEVENRVRTSLTSGFNSAPVGSLLTSKDSVLVALGLESTTPANSRELQPFIESVASNKGISDDIRLMALCRMPASSIK